MSTPVPSSHAGAWVISALAMIMLYFLGAPAVYFVDDRRIPDSPSGVWCHVLAEGYANPYFLVLNHTPLGTPMTAYFRWWEKLMAVY